MKKRLWIVGGGVLVLILVVWVMMFRNVGMYTVRQGIPTDAVFVVETPSFNGIHDKLCQNKVWASLKEYPYFEPYHANLELADSLSSAYPVLRKLLIDRPFAVSCHLTSVSGYDFLYVCDLGKLNVIQVFDGIVGKLLEKDKVVKKEELTEVTLKDTKLYYAIRANLLLVSLTPELVRNGMAVCIQPQEKNSEKYNGDIILDLNHRRLEKLLGSVLGDVADSSVLKTTELALTLRNEALYFRGETCPDRSCFSLLSSLNLVEGYRSDVGEIVSDHVAAYVSVCFSSFQELEDILLEEYKVNNLKRYAEYERVVHRWNKYLGVNIGELFTSWIGNEVAIIKPAVDKENRLDNLVLAVKSRDIDLAKDQLGYLTEQIGRKTPVRFREMEYNGHKINYLSLKGFFNLFLGSLFKKFDRPYYTFMGDYVVFSNSASTLAAMIKDYSLGKTLVRDEKYNVLMKQLGNDNNVYGYISSPETYEYLYRTLGIDARVEFVKNKGAFQSFESIGFVLNNSGSAYETRIIANYNVNASEEYEVRELNRELEEWADRIESGCYKVVIPDSIAITTRGSYSYFSEEFVWMGKLSNGEPDGIWTITDRGGMLLAQSFYCQGREEGETCFFYPNRVIAARILYEAGKIKSYQEFFQDGTLKSELEYNKGVRHGVARFYYSTGHLWVEGKYKKGKRSATWKYYRVTGELEKKLKF